MNDYADIRARVAAATPGPWKIQTSPSGYPQRIVNDSALLIAETFLGPEHSPADAVFIAAARTDIPALLDANAALAAEVARLEGELLASERGCTRLIGDAATARARVAALEGQLAQMIKALDHIAEIANEIGLGFDGELIDAIIVARRIFTAPAEAADKDVERLKLDLYRAEVSIQHWKTGYNSLKDERDELRLRITQLETRDESATRVTELERKVKNSQYMIDELNDWVEKLQDQIGDLTS